MYSYFENKKTEIFISYHANAYSFASHFHNKFEIAYCFSGIMQIMIGENLYALKKGDAAVIFPNTAHEYIRYEGKNNESTESISVICDTELLTHSIPDITTKQPESPIISSDLILENTALAFRKMVNYRNDTELLGWTYVVLSNLMEHIRFKSAQTASDLNLLPRIVAYIHTNFQKPLTIQYLAKEFGYNPSYIAHLFCDRLKVPFRTYLGSVRCEYVASQIRTTNKSLTEIAFESGYESLNTFCRCFKKHYSKTPSQYKKEIRN